MSIKLPTDRSAPLPPPPEGTGKKKISGQEEITSPKGPKKDAPPVTHEAVEFLDKQSLATRLEILARQAAEGNASFESILSQVMRETGIYNPQAAMEEADRKRHKEIEDLLQEIKENKEWTEENAAWERLGDLLDREFTPLQREQFEKMLQDQLGSLVS